MVQPNRRPPLLLDVVAGLKYLLELARPCQGFLELLIKKQIVTIPSQVLYANPVRSYLPDNPTQNNQSTYLDCLDRI